MKEKSKLNKVKTTNNEKLLSGLVSIIMPCYNGEKFIKETIESVLAQTYTSWELLIIDDGSKDSSVDIIKSYQQDQRIKLIQQANAGSAAARNNGIRQSKGQYMALLDSDDLWLPEFLEKQVNFMKEKKAVCVCCSYSRIDEDSNDVLRPVIAKSKITSKDMQAIDYVGTLTGLYDQSKYGKIYLREELNSLLDDYAFFTDVINLEGIAYGNPEILAKYRLRQGSMTSNKRKLIKKHYIFYRTHFGQNALQSMVSVIKWGMAGLIKYR
ncbi:glycosyltransferase family 2 protein [Limosilactobacillus fermentum]|nr:glycosyltransferase family 2 protein [Limosilactobacillus fermentum]